MFESVPDFEAQLLRHTAEGGVVWSEWHWTATGLNMAGVTMFSIEEDRIVWGRLYVEQVEEDGQDIDEAMRTITEGSQRAGDGRLEEASPTYSTLERTPAVESLQLALSHILYELTTPLTASPPRWGRSRKSNWHQSCSHAPVSGSQC
jgi:hypothetical protein